MKAYYKHVGLSTLCDLFGYTRQAWYAGHVSKPGQFEYQSVT